MDFVLDVIIHGLFASIAAIGFAVISNPSKSAVIASGILAAIGFAFRYTLLKTVDIDIATATFLAATLMGSLSLIFAKILRCPNEVFTFPSLLPMIPGMFSYKMFLAFAKFIRTDNPDVYQSLLVEATKNGLTAIFILIALVVGVSFPVMMFHKQSFTVTRMISRKKKTN